MEHHRRTGARPTRAIGCRHVGGHVLASSEAVGLLAGHGSRGATLPDQFGDERTPETTRRAEHHT
jgi:hypothetical protein